MVDDTDSERFEEIVECCPKDAPKTLFLKPSLNLDSSSNPLHVGAALRGRKIKKKPELTSDCFLVSKR